MNNSNDLCIRVLHVVTYMNRGGLETMLMNYYRHIDRSKVQFDFIVHRDFRGHYEDEIEALGGRIFRLPQLIPWGRKYHKALISFFKEHSEYKIIHVHQDCLSSVVLKVAKQFGLPVRIAHSHSSSQNKDIKYPIKLFYKKFIAKYATELFACSKEAGDWMFNGREYRIINNAIDTGVFRCSASTREEYRNLFSISPNSFVIGHVGSFLPVKNHTFILDVFKKVHEKETNAKLMLVGKGDLTIQRKIKEKVVQLGLEDNVIFTGVRTDVPDLMQAMDVFILPSLYEGLGIVLIEAQAAGLPCVMSDVVPEAAAITNLAHRVSLSDSPEVWAEKILSLKDTIRRDTYQEVIEAGYDIQENADWLMNYYIQMGEKYD